MAPSRRLREQTNAQTSCQLSAPGLSDRMARGPVGRRTCIRGWKKSADLSGCQLETTFRVLYRKSSISSNLVATRVGREKNATERVAWKNASSSRKGTWLHFIGRWLFKTECSPLAFDA